jgi:hypothetical protein
MAQKTIVSDALKPIIAREIPNVDSTGVIAAFAAIDDNFTELFTKLALVTGPTGPTGA